MHIGVYTGSIVDAAVGAHAVINASNPAVALGSGVSADTRTGFGGIQGECHGVQVKPQFGLGFEQEVITLDDGEFPYGLAHQLTEFDRAIHAPDDPRGQGVQHRPPFRPKASRGFSGGDGLAGRRQLGQAGRKVDGVAEDVGTAGDRKSVV